MEKKFLIPARQRIRQYIDNVKFGESVLDVGTGSGILARVALDAGVKDVTAIDINADAVKHVSSTLPSVKVILSDLFENVEGQFDTITFAAPWSEGMVKTPFDYALYDCGTVKRFLSEVNGFMKPGGVVWLQYCDAYPANFESLPGWIRDGGLSVINVWHYEMWGDLVKRPVKVFLYQLELEKIT